MQQTFRALSEFDRFVLVQADNLNQQHLPTQKLMVIFTRKKNKTPFLI
jgi:hypothetical protein